LIHACALTLAVLGVLPFTPPFATCDLDAFVATRTVHRQAPVGGSSSGPSIMDEVYVLSLVGEAKEYLKQLALTPAAPLPTDLRAAASVALPGPASREPVPPVPASALVLRI